MKSKADENHYLYIVYDFDEQLIKTSVLLTMPGAMTGATTILSGLFRLSDPKSNLVKLAFLMDADG